MPPTGQEVTVRFEPIGSGTRVTLVAANWERWGKGTARARKGYNIGWGYVLNVWAQHRTFGTVLLDALAKPLAPLTRLRGGLEAQIDKAGGEMPRSATP